MSVKRGIALGAGITVVVVVCVLVFHAAFIKNNPVPNIPNPTKTAQPAALATLDQKFQILAKEVEPSVVSIRTEEILETAPRQISPFGEPFSDNRAESRTKEKFLGAGFIINSGGYILTNSYVVENASRIRVKLHDSRAMDGIVVGTDPKTDIAVIKIGTKGLPSLPFAASNSAKIGEWVAALGSPAGGGETVATGIILAKGKPAGSEISLLQTDAAINTSNNGGPLVNLRGEVVGVNIIVGASNKKDSGVAFAIPSEIAQKAYRELTKTREKKRGWIGASIQGVEPEMASFYRLLEGEGAMITELAPDGPAMAAGLRPGDVILKYNEKPVRAFRDLSTAVLETRIGTSVRMRIGRDGRVFICSVVVGERPSSIARRFYAPESRNRARLGIAIENVTPEIRSQLNLRSIDGVIVIEVAAGSPADIGGIQPGDVIRQINQIPIRRTSDLISVLRNLDNDENRVVLGIERLGARFFLTLWLE